MVYAPHILQVERFELRRDEYGQTTGKESRWEDLCACRCDDNDVKRFLDDNGEVFTPNYHAVCEACEVREGDRVRCVDKEDKDEAKGEGRIFKVYRHNYFGNVEIWF
jgi:hypothetical protein